LDKAVFMKNALTFRAAVDSAYYSIVLILATHTARKGFGAAGIFNQN